MPFDLPATKDFNISWVSNLFTISVQGRIQDFKLGGGGGALRKNAPSGGRRENCWGISCEKITILRQKIIFFPIAEGGAKIFGVFRVKNHEFTPKNHIFSNYWGGGGGGGAGCTPIWIRPWCS